jgi:hypothetical protein
MSYHRYYLEKMVTKGKKKYPYQSCTLTGKGCVREDHDCDNCERGSFAKTWEALHGTSILNAAKSTESPLTPGKP